PAVFLKHAAVLHADAVSFAGRFPASPDDAPPPAAPRRNSGDRERSREATPPLLTNERIVLTRDGQIISDAAVNWNLPFARSLLDVLVKPPVPAGHEEYEFVASWYHAVAAFLLAHRMNGDATSHLEHAARVLPNDARVLFDRGTYAEAIGLPIYQAVRD